MFFLQRILWISYWIKIRPSSHYLYTFLYKSKFIRTEKCFSWRVTWVKCPWDSFLKRKESVEQNTPEMVCECHPLEIGLSPNFLWTLPFALIQIMIRSNRLQIFFALIQIMMYHDIMIRSNRLQSDFFIKSETFCLQLEIWKSSEFHILIKIDKFFPLHFDQIWLI